jgi:hypothetical protein
MPLIEDILEGVHVGVFQGFERLVEAGADVGLEMTDLGPVRFVGDKERVLVGVGELDGDDIVGHALDLEIPGELLSFLVEQIAQPLQE